jgi:hypothetical protein
MPGNARRIVIVTWHFPPSEEIGGKIVWRLAKALAASGCDVRVLTPPVAEILHRDDGYAREMPPGLRVVRSGMGRDLFGALARFVRSLKARRATPAAPDPAGADATTPAAPRRVSRAKSLVNLFAAWLPQRRDRWVGTGAKTLRDLLAAEPADLVLSVSPAFQAHEVVLHARDALGGARWFAWLHDPGAHYMQASGFIVDRPLLERLQYRRRAAIEQRVFRGVDRMLVTTPELSGVYAAFLPELAAPLVTPCGFDPAEFPSPSPHPRGQKLVIVHVGTIYQQRTPRPIVESLARLRAAGRYARGEVEMEFVGRLENEEGKQLGSIIESLDMSDVVTFIPQVSQAEALRIVSDADIGLVLAPGQPMQVPAKIFEYIGLRRPVLALSDGATSALVRETGNGYACEQHELDTVLDELLSAWRDGRLDAFGPALDAAARRYDISTIAHGLVDEVEREHGTS